MLLVIGNTFFFQWEVTLMQWLQGGMSDFLTKLATIFSYFGEEAALVFVVGLLYWCIDKDFGRYVATNIMVAVVANPLIKNIFLRRRPYMDNAAIKCFKPAHSGSDIYDVSAQGYSLPSGHSMNSVTVYGSLAARLKKPLFYVISIVIPLIVGISRVVLGVHYPTDVLAGWAVGAGVIVLMTWLQKVVKKRWLLYTVIAVISLAGVFYCKSSDYYSAYGLMLGFFAGDLFESRFVNFTKAKSFFRGILRLVGGIGLFLILNQGLKLPFSDEFLSAQTPLSYAYRVVRYGVAVFAIIGVYPMIFKVFNKDRKATENG